jgi:hypothetical protein
MATMDPDKQIAPSKLLHEARLYYFFRSKKWYEVLEHFVSESVSENVSGVVKF